MVRPTTSYTFIVHTGGTCLCAPDRSTRPAESAATSRSDDVTVTSRSASQLWGEGRISATHLPPPPRPRVSNPALRPTRPCDKTKVTAHSAPLRHCSVEECGTVFECHESIGNSQTGGRTEAAVLPWLSFLMPMAHSRPPSVARLGQLVMWRRFSPSTAQRGRSSSLNLDERNGKFIEVIRPS